MSFIDNIADKEKFVCRCCFKNIILTRWVQLSNLYFDVIYWSIKDKFIHVLNQC